MFVVRPRGIVGTPRLLAKDLDCPTRVYPNTHYPHRKYDYRYDFFMTPVDPAHIRHCPPEYIKAYDFMKRDKYVQRKALEFGGVPVPRTVGSHGDAWGLAFDTGLRFVVRPLRHSAGNGFRVTDNAIDFVPGQQYLSELYPKKREYRIIFVFGKPVIYLRKKPNEGVTDDLPWGHVNSTFQTINDVAGCRLSTTDCATRLGNFPVIKGAHIIAADIMWNDQADRPYVVLELNACPALTIDENRSKIAEAVLAR